MAPLNDLVLTWPKQVRVVCPYSQVRQLSLDSAVHASINDINEAVCVVVPLHAWKKVFAYLSGYNCDDVLLVAN